MYLMRSSILNTSKSKQLVTVCKCYTVLQSKSDSFGIKCNKNDKTLSLGSIGRNGNTISRQLFGFPINTSKTKKYSERRVLGYSKEQLFEVVSRVEDYHLFVPACVKSRVIERNERYLCADLEIGIPPLIWESYTSRVTFSRPHSVTAKCIDGKLFKHLETHWKFSDGLANNSQTCTLDFSISFEFRSLVHSQLVRVFFDEMVRQTVNAFLKRAQQLYGKQSRLYVNTNPFTPKT